MVGEVVVDILMSWPLLPWPEESWVMPVAQLVLLPSKVHSPTRPLESEELLWRLVEEVLTCVPVPAL